MSKRTSLLIGLLGFIGAVSAPGASRPLLLISVDGMRPDYVLKADEHGLKLPHLRALAREGSFATGVRGVLPTATYPSHTTIITGASPARHGIYSNHPFEISPVKELDTWYYYAEDIRVPTLWKAAEKGGYIVGSVSWPVTVGAASIRWNIPEYALTRTTEDLKITRGASTPGLMAELESKAGRYLTDVHDTVKRDWARTRYAIELIRQKQVGFITVHLAATDSLQHREGPFTTNVERALEEIDLMIGEMNAAIHSLDQRAVICVVSDHGFAPVSNVVYLDSVFVKAGLLTLKSHETTIEKSVVVDWIARPWHAGGSAAIVLKNPTDGTARAKVKAVLDELAADKNNGIAEILEESAVQQSGGAPTAQFWVTMRAGYMLSASLQPSIVSKVSARGAHGYAPSVPEMLSTFMIAGAGIAAGRDLGVIDMRSIAPTLARVMEIPFPSAEVAAQELFYANR